MSQLKNFRVRYREPGEDASVDVFDCQAEDASHAKEQCEDAYPGCTVVSVSPVLSPKLKQGDIVEVHGWVMLTGVTDGKWHVQSVVMDLAGLVYRLRKHRGKRIVRHYARYVDPWVRDESCEDLNKIVVVDG